MKSIRGLIVAAFAVTALVVTPAVASASAGFESNKEQLQTWHGIQTQTLNFYTSGGLRAFCSPENKPLTFEAPVGYGRVNIATTSSVTNPGCQGGSLNMNSCQLEFDPSGNGSVRIGPPGCGSAKFFTEFCYGQDFSLPAGSMLDAKYENVGSKNEAKVMVEIDDESVEYTTSGGGCSGSGKFTNLEIIGGALEITDISNVFKEEIGFRMVPGDIFMGGTESPMMEAPEYPSRMSGGVTEGGKTILWESHSKVKVTCSGAIYNGNELPASNLSLGNISYSGCSSPLGSATATASGCQYEYSGLKYLAKDEYDGATKINCSGSIKIALAPSGCTITIPSQTLSARTTLVNKEVANDAAVIATMTGSGVKYTAEGSICPLIGVPKSGTYEDANIHSDILLRGGI